VIGPPGRLEASTCLLISETYYSCAWHLSELWNFVKPEFRKSRNAEALIEFGKKCSNEIGIPLITGIITNSKLAQKVRLYRKRLGYPAGAFFIYNAEWVGSNKPLEENFWPMIEGKTFVRAVSQTNGTSAHVR
jgi:hypothetical protein